MLRNTLLKQDKTEKFIYEEANVIITKTIKTDDPNVLHEYFGYDAGDEQIYLH